MSEHPDYFHNTPVVNDEEQKTMHMSFENAEETPLSHRGQLGILREQACTKLNPLVIPKKNQVEDQEIPDDDHPSLPSDLMNLIGPSLHQEEDSES